MTAKYEEEMYFEKYLKKKLKIIHSKDANVFNSLKMKWMSEDKNRKARIQSARTEISRKKSGGAADAHAGRGPAPPRALASFPLAAAWLEWLTRGLKQGGPAGRRAHRTEHGTAIQSLTDVGPGPMRQRNLTVPCRTRPCGPIDQRCWGDNFYVGRRPKGGYRIWVEPACLAASVYSGSSAYSSVLVDFVWLWLSSIISIN